MAIAFVKVTELRAGSGSASGTVTATAGNALIVCVASFQISGSGVLTVSGGGTWTTNRSGTMTSALQNFFASCPSATGGSATITASVTNSGAVTAFVYEFSGMAPSSMYEGAASSTNGNGATKTTGALTNTQANALKLAITGVDSGATVAFTSTGTGWTMPSGTFPSTGSEPDATWCVAASAYKIVSASQSDTEAWTRTGADNWVADIATYLAPAGGGGTSVTPDAIASGVVLPPPQVVGPCAVLDTYTTQETFTYAQLESLQVDYEGLETSLCQSVAPGTIGTAAAVYAPTAGLQVAPGGIGTAEQVYAPTVKLGVLPGTIGTAAAVYPPTVALAVLPNTIGTAAVVYPPTVGQVSPQSVAPNLIPTGEQVYAPTLVLLVLPGAIATAVQVYPPNVTITIAGAVQPNTIQTGEQVYPPNVLQASPQVVQPNAIATAEQVFAPSVVVAAQTVRPDAIGTAEVVYAPEDVRLVLPPIVVSPDGIGSAAAVYAPLVVVAPRPPAPPLVPAVPLPLPPVLVSSGSGAVPPLVPAARTPAPPYHQVVHGDIPSLKPERSTRWPPLRLVP